MSLWSGWFHVFKLMGNIQAVPIWHKVSYLKVNTGHTLFLTGTCVGHWPVQPSYFHHCDKYLKHLPGIKGLLWLAISKGLIHGQVGLWTAFRGQWWSTITPLGARMWKKARRRDLGPTMSPRHVTNNTESTSTVHCCGGDQAFTRRILMDVEIQRAVAFLKHCLISLCSIEDFIWIHFGICNMLNTYQNMCACTHIHVRALCV